MSFSKLLVANRGEIACRVMRTAQALGYRCVAVYSEADANAPHVQLADEAVCIGAAPAAQSYLDIAAVLQAARATGADALHPGYGFLSERAELAQACVDAGIVFVGPPAAAIRAMGDKAQAKRRMLAAGVPCVPGYLGEEQGEARLIEEGARLGAPLLVKAVAGGGGRGMRLVHDLANLPEALASARREAESAFGEGTLMLEKLVGEARHIEVQVFADAHGQALHLGERDCTAQRRRQKVIEEAPSPVVSAALREAMGRDAVAAALAVGYRGAGTVEFIVDAQMNHYFLEMNTRLQVEHPVTECITGLDLVEWQLRVAAGEPLPLRQEEVRFHGHAIEVRLYAEDPDTQFAPQTGTVLHWRPEGAALPAGTRIDSGVHEGGSVTPYYDAMVAKLIAHGRDRADATRRLVSALERTPMLGLRHNAGWLVALLQHPRFTQATMHTTLLDEWAGSEDAPKNTPAPSAEAWQLAAALLTQAAGPPAAALRPGALQPSALTLRCGSEERRVPLEPQAVQVLGWQDHHLRYAQGGVQRQAVALREGGRLHLALGARVWVFDEASPWPAASETNDPSRATAPVAGVVAKVHVQPGQSVQPGDALVSVEAMKMEMGLHASAAGTVREVLAVPGQAVAAGTLLVLLEITA